MDWTFLIPLGVVVVVGLVVLGHYNRMIALDERCATALSDIDVQLKHRHSVIPSLVETVRGIAGHETNAITAITNARTAVGRAASEEARHSAEMELGQRITFLVQQAEAYPDLAASSHFRDLRVELSDIENRITASRRYYNLTVDEFNATIRQFPGNLIGGFARLDRRSRFDLGSERLLADEPVAFRF